MSPSDKRALAKAKGVSVATVNRWIRVYGEETARTMARTSASAAGRLARAAHPEYGRRWYEP